MFASTSVLEALQNLTISSFQVPSQTDDEHEMLIHAFMR